MRRLAALFLAMLLAPRPAAADTGNKELEALLAETDEIARQVSKLRGLPIKKKIQRGLMSQAQILARVKLRLAEEYPEAEIRAEERAFKRLGLLPRDTDYKQLVLDLLVDQVAGFYDPKDQQLYIADWIDPELQRPVLAHEIDHVLQDQSFDLEKLLAPDKDNADARIARQALVEGDGLAVMIEYTAQGTGVDLWSSPLLVNAMKTQITTESESGPLATAPLFLKESLLFPYLAGVGLIAEARRHHPWSRVDRMYRDPPRSSEQVLHPEKYFAGEKPLVVKTRPLPALRKHSRLYENTLGELGYSVLLRQHGVRDQRAWEAAEGWGGDRFLVLAPPDDDGASIDDLVLVALSTWDTEGDAVEAYEAAAEILGGLSGQPDCQREETLSRCVGRDARESTVERKDSRVLIVVGAPAVRADAVRADAWRRWRAPRTR